MFLGETIVDIAKQQEPEDNKTNILANETGITQEKCVVETERNNYSDFC